MDTLKVSAVVPVYNEAMVIYEVLRRVLIELKALGQPFEIIVVDDGSTDGTIERVRAFLDDHKDDAAKIIHHTGIINHGKGAAVRAGFKLSTGDIVIIQDGDLEYSPSDYRLLLAPFEKGAMVVFGSRFLNGNPPEMRKLNLVANKLLTWTVRLLYRQKITDEATGYKAFHRSVLNNIKLKCKGFEFCPEITSKVLQAGYPVVEVPIQYNPRGILAGKKIKARDGFIAMWWLIKLRFRRTQKTVYQSAELAQ